MFIELCQKVKGILQTKRNKKETTRRKHTECVLNKLINKSKATKPICRDLLAN